MKRFHGGNSAEVFERFPLECLWPENREAGGWSLGRIPNGNRNVTNVILGFSSDIAVGRMAWPDTSIRLKRDLN